MNEIYEYIIKRLENKNKELKKQQDHFTVMCSNEMDSQCFEKNAINDLITMQQLKSEIKELKHVKEYLKITI